MHEGAGLMCRLERTLIKEALFFVGRAKLPANDQ